MVHWSLPIEQLAYIVHCVEQAKVLGHSVIDLHYIARHSVHPLLGRNLVQFQFLYEIFRVFDLVFAFNLTLIKGPLGHLRVFL